MERTTPSPQARGRELARLGRRLWEASALRTGQRDAVRAAAEELRRRHPDLSHLQSFRYACGLSQDQAAARYNAVTGHRTSLGGTTINAWETWSRRRGGTPPTFAGLLVLASAYARGPLGAVTEERLTPLDLVADAVDRLPAEDRMALRAAVPGAGPIGSEFTLDVPANEFANPVIRMFTLPNPEPSQLLMLDWATFGLGIEQLRRQIGNLGYPLDADACLGVDEAGLVVATFLASAQFGRCAVGYLRPTAARAKDAFDPPAFAPELPEAPTIVVCDFASRSPQRVQTIAARVRQRYPDARIYYALLGAVARNQDVELTKFDDLPIAEAVRSAGFEGVFIAAAVAAPGMKPPLGLR